MARFYQGIGERIKSLREEKGYDLEDFAALINMDINILSALENGRKRNFVDHLSKVAEFLGVTTDYLIYGNEKKNKSNDFNVGNKI